MTHLLTLIKSSSRNSSRSIRNSSNNNSSNNNNNIRLFSFLALPSRWDWTPDQTDTLFAGCLTSQQHASVSQERICSDNFTCCHTEREVADQTFHLTQSHYTDTGPISPSTDPITPGAWQGSHWNAIFLSVTRPRKNPSASGIRTRALPLSRQTPLPLGQRGGPNRHDGERHAETFRISLFLFCLNKHLLVYPCMRDERARACIFLHSCLWCL